jgi:hypothetical protein
LSEKYDGSLTPYPDDQLFYVWMNTDESYGTLQSGWGQQGSWLFGGQPFKFIAAESISADSVIVRLEAEASSGGISVSVRHGPKEELQKQAVLSMAKLMKIASVYEKPVGGKVKLKGKVAPKAKLLGVVPTSSNVGLWKKMQIGTKTMEDGAACVPFGTVVVTTANNPPVITRVLFDPSRQYFQLGSMVTVTAEASDPDGDAVTLSYIPSQSFELDNLGDFVVTVTATDSKGASTTRMETLHILYLYASPAPGSVIDGLKISFTIAIMPKGIAADSYEWSWEPNYSPAGNLPTVDFMSDKTQPTVTVEKAWWYAFPDLACGPNSARLSSTYTLKAKVLFGQDQFDPSTEMMVSVPATGGTTSNPYVTGSPQISLVYTAIRTEWRISGIGNLTRKIGNIKIPDIPSTSQFYQKILAHEQKHLDQQVNGLASNIWTVDNLWKKIRNYRAASEAELNKGLLGLYKEFNNEEKKKWKLGKKARELEAYSVGDKIPPFYLYQLCNQLDGL